MARTSQPSESTNSLLKQLITDVSEIKSDVRTLKSDVKTLQLDIHELKSDVHELKQDVSKLKTDMTDLKNYVTEKTDFVIGELQDIRDEFTLHQGQYERIDDTLTALDIRVGRLENKPL